MAYETTPYTNEDEKDEGITPLAGGMGSQFQTSENDEKRVPASQAGSGMFTNIQKYTEGNTKTAKNMAEKIGGGFTSTAQNIQDEAAGKLGDFQSQYEPEQQRYSSAAENVNKYIAEAGKSLDQDEVERRRNVLQGLSSGGSYVDLQDVDLSQQQLAQENLKTKAANTLSEPGTRQALKETFNRPDYTQGMRNLDYLALRAEPAQQILQQRGEQATSGLDQFNLAAKQQETIDKENALRNLAQSYQTGGEKDVVKQVRSAEDILKGAIEQRRLAETNKRTGERAYLERVGSAIGVPQAGLDPIQLEEMYRTQGLTGNLATLPGYEDYLGTTGIGAGYKTYGVDPTKYLGAQAADELRYGNVATSEEVARANALASLAGTPETAFVKESLGAGSDVFREAEYAKAVANAKASMEAAAAQEKARREAELAKYSKWVSEGGRGRDEYASAILGGTKSMAQIAEEVHAQMQAEASAKAEAAARAAAQARRTNWQGGGRDGAPQGMSHTGGETDSGFSDAGRTA